MYYIFRLVCWVIKLSWVIKQYIFCQWNSQTYRLMTSKHFVKAKYCIKNYYRKTCSYLHWSPVHLPDELPVCFTIIAIQPSLINSLYQVFSSVDYGVYCVWISFQDDRTKYYQEVHVLFWHVLSVLNLVVKVKKLLVMVFFVINVTVMIKCEKVVVAVA